MADEDYHDQPVYWLVTLELARERGDFETAAFAKRELERLGIRVTYPRQRRRKRERGQQSM